jgi:hypothetical protein
MGIGFFRPIISSAFYIRYFYMNIGDNGKEKIVSGFLIYKG